MKTKKRPRTGKYLKDVNVEEISVVEHAAALHADGSPITFAILKAATVDPEAEMIAGALKTLLDGEDFPAPSLKDFKEAIVMLDQNRDRIPEDVLSDVRYLAFIAAEALAEGLIKLKEAEADGADEGANGKGKTGLKKTDMTFPSLGRANFLGNFVFGSRLDRWKADEAIEKAELEAAAAAAAGTDGDDDGEPEPARKPTRKSLSVDEVLDEGEEDEQPVKVRSFTLGGVGVAGLAPESKPKSKPVKKAADDAADDDPEILWPSLSGQQV
jgi:hypothetical protein